LWFAGGLLLAVLAGVIAFITLLQTSRAPQTADTTPKVQVLVAARELPLQTVLAAGDVTPREVAPEMVPQDALTDPQEAVGLMTTVAIARDEVILQRRLIKPDYVGPRIAFVMDPKQVIVALPTTDLMCSIDIIRPGDHIDLMFSINPNQLIPDSGEVVKTLTVLHDVRVADVVRVATGSDASENSGAPRALLLTLDPQDALNLKFFRDIGGSFDLALRSPAAAPGPFNVVVVDSDYIMQRFGLRGR